MALNSMFFLCLKLSEREIKGQKDCLLISTEVFFLVGIFYPCTGSLTVLNLGLISDIFWISAYYARGWEEQIRFKMLN